MLTEWKKNQASEIANVLSHEGMIFGKELDDFIRLEETNGLIKLREDERDEFIDEVIKRVEYTWQRIVAVYDYKEKTTSIYLNAKEAADFLGITLEKIYIYKCKRHKLKRRYLISGYKPDLKEISLGLNSIDKSRYGYFLKI